MFGSGKGTAAKKPKKKPEDGPVPAGRYLVLNDYLQASELFAQLTHKMRITTITTNDLVECHAITRKLSIAIYMLVVHITETCDLKVRLITKTSPPARRAYVPAHPRAPGPPATTTHTHLPPHPHTKATPESCGSREFYGSCELAVKKMINPNALKRQGVANDIVSAMSDRVNIGSSSHLTAKEREEFAKIKAEEKEHRSSTVQAGATSALKNLRRLGKATNDIPLVQQVKKARESGKWRDKLWLVLELPHDSWAAFGVYAFLLVAVLLSIVMLTIRAQPEYMNFGEYSPRCQNAVELYCETWRDPNNIETSMVTFILEK